MHRACGRCRKPRATGLQPREALELGTAQSELSHASLRDEFALPHDQHLIEVIEQRETMYRRNDASAREGVEQIRIHTRFGGRVQARRRLIQQYEGTTLRGEN